MKERSESNGFGEMPEQLQGKLNVGTFDSALKEPDIASALRMLYDPGEEKEVHKLMMRSDMPDLPFLLGIAHYMSMCDEFDDEEGRKEAYLILAGYPAVHKEKPFDNRTEQVVRAIIGDMERKTHKPGGHGFVETFKQKAGLDGGGQ